VPLKDLLQKSEMLSIDQLFSRKVKGSKALVAHLQGSHVSKDIHSPRNEWRVEGGRVHGKGL